MTKIERLEQQLDYLRKEIAFEKAKLKRKEMKQKPVSDYQAPDNL